MARSAVWKVGELARRTGLTVRTLHYYDEIGLLSPSHHTDAGYRLYTGGDIAHLQQIMSLRQLGFSLEEIRGLLERPDVSPQRVIRCHIAQLKEHIERQHALCRRLEGLAALLGAAEEVSVDLLMDTIEVMNTMEQTFDKYFTPEQRAEIRERGQQIGEERIRQVEAEWPQLIAQVRAEMEQGTDPADERVQALARRWKALVDEFTGGNAGIEQSLGTMYQHEPQMREYSGVNTEIFSYISKALAIAKGD